MSKYKNFLADEHKRHEARSDRADITGEDTGGFVGMDLT